MPNAAAPGASNALPPLDKGCRGCYMHSVVFVMPNAHTRPGGVIRVFEALCGRYSVSPLLSQIGGDGLGDGIIRYGRVPVLHLIQFRIQAPG